MERDELKEKIEDVVGRITDNTADLEDTTEKVMNVFAGFLENIKVEAAPASTTSIPFEKAGEKTLKALARQLRA